MEFEVRQALDRIYTRLVRHHVVAGCPCDECQRVLADLRALEVVTCAIEMHGAVGALPERIPGSVPD